MLRLRLFHAADGARIAYREGGTTGQPLILWHSRGLSHREFHPAVGELSDRVRLILPDLPLHGDSEEGTEFSYDLDWVAGLIAECSRDIGGARPRVGGSGLGAQLLLHAIDRGLLEPSQLVLLPSRLHRPQPTGASGTLARLAAKAVAPAGPFAARSVTRAVLRPELLTRDAGPRALSDAASSRRALLESAERSNAWRSVIASWDGEAFRGLIAAYAQVRCPTLLLWGGDDQRAPLRGAEEAADLIDDALLRTLPGTGPLLAYDDPVGFGREITAFLRGMG